MSLVLSIALFGISFVCLRILYRAARTGKEHWWVSESALSYFLVPGLVIMLAFAAGLLVDVAYAWDKQAISLVDAGLALAIFGITIAVWIATGSWFPVATPASVTPFPMPSPDSSTNASTGVAGTGFSEPPTQTPRKAA